MIAIVWAVTLTYSDQLLCSQQKLAQSWLLPLCSDVATMASILLAKETPHIRLSVENFLP